METKVSTTSATLNWHKLDKKKWFAAFAAGRQTYPLNPAANGIEDDQAYL